MLCVGESSIMFYHTESFQRESFYFSFFNCLIVFFALRRRKFHYVLPHGKFQARAQIVWNCLFAVWSFRSLATETLFGFGINQVSIQTVTCAILHPSQRSIHPIPSNPATHSSAELHPYCSFVSSLDFPFLLGHQNFILLTHNISSGGILVRWPLKTPILVGWSPTAKEA